MRTASSSALVAGLVACLGASHAAAQAPAAPPVAAAPAAKAEPAEDAVSEVVVTGERQAVVTSIDRKSYNVGRDLSAANGSVTDAMRNLPSVEVDVDGNVSLRGESSVQILIDGKPSAMFSGESRAQAMQQLPASSVESIEIITNPSAEFSPDGTGGVINIITKKNRKTGVSGSLQVGAGSFGRWNVNALAAYKVGKLNLSGNAGMRHQGGRQQSVGQSTRIDPILNERSDTTYSSANRSTFDAVNSSGTAEYDINDKDRLTFTASMFAGEAEFASSATEMRRNAAGVVTRDFDTISRGTADNVNVNLSTGWRHAFTEPGRVFNLTARYSQSDGENVDRLITYIYRTPSEGRVERRTNANDYTGSGISASYVLPLANTGSFKAGYDYRRDVSDQVAAGALIDAGGMATNLADVANRFVMAETNHQAYATYQRPFGKLTALGGLRLEWAGIAYDQRTTAISGDNDYFDFHPSLHLQYALTETQNLTVSYSHRVQRPNGWQLNPFLVVENEFNARAGNPDLRPQETHSLEAAWAWQESGRSAGATLYYRQNYNVIGPVNRFLTPTLILNTFENQGESRSGGMELETGGRIGERITYRGNANISYNEIQRSSLAGGGTRAAFGYTVRGNIDYKPTDKDLIQLTGNYSGKQIFAQGYRVPSGAVNLGYQRKFRQNLIGVITVSDIFATQRWGSVTDTPTLFGAQTSTPAGRTFSLGVTRVLGGRPAREGQFEYDAGGGAGPS